jgi:hypothetical protein
VLTVLPSGALVVLRRGLTAVTLLVRTLLG